jgi:hypothetical protein
MFYADKKKRIIHIQQIGMQRNKLKHIKGAEPKTRSGETRPRQGKIAYGVGFIQSILDVLGDRTKIKGGDGKYWNIKRYKFGEYPFPLGFGKAKRIKVMGRIKHRPSKHKFQGVNRLDWSKTQDNIRRKR